MAAEPSNVRPAQISQWWIQLVHEEMSRQAVEAFRLTVMNRHGEETQRNMTLDELLAITEAGPAVVMMSRDDALELMRRLQRAELQVEAARKQEVYAATRAERDKQAVATIRARLDELQMQKEASSER